MASVGGSKNSVSLNIMPMLDIFSILILFLLMNFSSDPLNHDLNEGIELPESATIQSLDEIPTITVTKTDVMINDLKVSTIVDKKIKESDRSQGAVYPLYIELDKLAKANKRLLEGRSEEEKNKPLGLTIEFDKSHDFALLKRIMVSAEQADFVRFKLMVSKELN